MNWPENDEQVDDQDQKRPSPSDNALFLGDAGQLPFETRRALVQLLAGPALDSRRHPKLWPILLRDEVIIRQRLSDLFLDLVIDRELQVAFTRQADTGDLEVPILLRRAQLTFLDSVLLLFLRQRLTQADAQGERAVISAEDMTEHLTLYERALSTDRAGFTKRAQAAIEKTKQHSILQKLRASDDRFEISPTLKLLFTAEEIQLLTGLYQRMAISGLPENPSDSEEQDRAEE